MFSKDTANGAGSSNMVDVLIIGASHAGLSAALTLYRALHRCIVFDSGTPRGKNIASSTHLTPGWEAKDPQRIRDGARTELEKSGLVDFVSARITTAKKLPDGTFEVGRSDGETWQGKKLLLATGMEDIYPEIEGYRENYGLRIFYCMFCYGYELRGSSSAGLIATGTLNHAYHALTNAQDAQKFVSHITIYTDSNPTLAADIRAQLPHGMSVDDRKLIALRSGTGGTSMILSFADGEDTEEVFLVHKPTAVLDETLPNQLCLELAAPHGIKVTAPFNETSVGGVFAAGDCASPLRMIPNAMSMGSFAGCGIARQLPVHQMGSARALDSNGVTYVRSDNDVKAQA